MGYTKKAIVWLVVLGSLVWLTTATAKTGNEGKGKDDTTQGSGNSGHGNSGSGNSGSGDNGSTGPTGATGPSGGTDGKGNDNSGNNGDSSEPQSGSSMGAKSNGQVMVKLPGSDKAVPLDGSQTIPLDSLVDASNGK